MIYIVLQPSFALLRGGLTRLWLCRLWIFSRIFLYFKSVLIMQWCEIMCDEEKHIIYEHLHYWPSSFSQNIVYVGRKTLKEGRRMERMGLDLPFLFVPLHCIWFTLTGAYALLLLRPRYGLRPVHWQLLIMKRTASSSTFFSSFRLWDKIDASTTSI